MRGTGVVLREEVEGKGEGAQLAALTGRTLLLLLGVCIDSTTEDSVPVISVVSDFGFGLRAGEGGLSDVTGADPVKKLLALLTATWPVHTVT